MKQRNDEYISVQQAAKYFGVNMQCIYKAIYRKKLKFIKRLEANAMGYMRMRTYTTKQWLDEYNLIKQDKDFMRFNGKLMFEPEEKGTYSSNQAQRYLGWSKNKLSHYRLTGQIKFVKKGYYYLYEKEDLDALRQSVEEKEPLLKTG